MDTAWIIASATSVLAVVFFFAWLMARGARTRSAEEPAARPRDEALLAAEAKAEASARAQEDLRAKLDKAKDELKRAKKKTYEAQQAGKSQPDVQAALEAEQLRQVAELDLARADAQQAQAQAAALTKQIAGLKRECERLKQELQTQAQAPETKPEPTAEPAPEAPLQSAPEEDRDDEIKQLKAELKKLKGKLEAARKKERNDSQIYRVTKSKLELALERIEVMEDQLAKGRSPEREA